MTLIEVPLCFIRDYTVPMAEHASWNRNRASIVPMTITIAFFYLGGSLTDDGLDWEKNEMLQIGVYAMIPGLLIGLIIRFKARTAKAPEFLITIYSVISFVMSILWIKFSADCIMDLL